MRIISVEIDAVDCAIVGYRGTKGFDVVENQFTRSKGKYNEDDALIPVTLSKPHCAVRQKFGRVTKQNEHN